MWPELIPQPRGCENIETRKCFFFFFNEVCAVRQVWKWPQGENLVLRFTTERSTTESSFFFFPSNSHNSYKIIKLLKSFKIPIVAPTCFGLHKPSSGRYQPVLRRSYNVDIGYKYRYAYGATVPITSNNDICNRYQHCNFGEAQAECALMTVYVNRNMSEQLLGF